MLELCSKADFGCLREKQVYGDCTVLGPSVGKDASRTLLDCTDAIVNDSLQIVKLLLNHYTRTDCTLSCFTIETLHVE